MADREGFEPSVPFRARTLSRGVVSASSPTCPFVEENYNCFELNESLNIWLNSQNTQKLATSLHQTHYVLYRSPLAYAFASLHTNLWVHL